MIAKPNNQPFLLSGKKLGLILLSFVVAALLHNLVYGLFKSYFDNTSGGDEPFFFIIAVIVIPAYFIFCFFYTFIKMIIDKSIFNKDFILRAIFSIIIGSLAGYIINLQFLSYVLAITISFCVYYLLKTVMSITRIREKTS